MKLSISASSVKSWFQYRCERKFVYESMDRQLREAVPILEQIPIAPWAEFGQDYELEVVSAYAKEPEVSLLRPKLGFDDLGESASISFLRGLTSHTAAYQLVLTGTPVLQKYLSLENIDVTFRRGLVDLVLMREEDGRRIFRIVDIKSTHDALSFHKMQVAWYAWMLRGVIEQSEISAFIDNDAEIWHRPTLGVSPDNLWQRTTFRLRSYESVVLDWTRRELIQATKKTVLKGIDDTNFHIYFKCEQCRFLEHCYQVICDSVPPEKIDISAVPGLSQQSKSALHRMGIRTVGEMVNSSGRLLSKDISDWRLSTRGGQLLERAKSLINKKPQLLRGNVTLRMPPRSEIQIYLLADRDPMAARLATIGALVVDNREVIALVVELVKSSKDEAGALQNVLGVVIKSLKKVDAENRAGAGKICHIFVYEPAESRDLAEALGRHLDKPEIQLDLIELVRMFPPENIVPEPEYRGYHTLPASALRSVVEDVLALPVKVSYDLARVSAALMNEDPAPEPFYIPKNSFARPFSSLLALSICRDLEEGKADEVAIRADVEARLSAMRGLACWLEDLNEKQETSNRFLRLNKAPFLLYATLDPLNARSLDLLRAQALLENRSGLVETLNELAQPLDRRQARLKSIGNMVLLKSDERPGGGRWFLFSTPLPTMDCDIKPGDPMLLLSDGHPDYLLNPRIWQDIQVSLHPPRPGYPVDNLFVTMSNKSWESEVFQEMYSRLGNRGWVLDRGHFDVTSERLETFLSQIDLGES